MTASRALSGPGADYLTGLRRWLALAVLLVFLAAGAAVRLADHADPLTALAVAVAIASAATLVRATARGVLSASVVIAAATAVIGNGTSSNLGWFALCVLVAWCVLGAGHRAGVVFWGGSLLLLGGEWLWAGRDNGWAAWAAGMTFAVAAALLVRHEFVLTTQLRAAQAGLAERSRGEERARIARELHDVVAHCLTVSLLHVSSARMAVQYDDRAEADRALEQAERLGRQSLEEVRTTMGLLRSPTQGGAGTAPPAPGLDDLDDLVEQFSRAGLEVCASIEGGRDGAAATTGSVLYRIAQESLTNAARHAPGSAVVLRLTGDASSISLTVDTDTPPGDGTGLGLIGMRERAEAVGGSCTSGPSGTGWQVHAVVPKNAGSGESR